MSADERRAWVAALDALELEIAATRTLLADCRHSRDLPIVAPWSAPAGLGPLPPDLQPRADSILTRQLVLAGALAGALATTRRHAAVVLRLQAGRDPGRPSYLDQAM
jgi:hypothetical protein